MGVRVLQSVRFRFAIHSNPNGERQAILWLEVVTPLGQSLKAGCRKTACSSKQSRVVSIL
jgi:hypothetical protein